MEPSITGPYPPEMIQAAQALQILHTSPAIAPPISTVTTVLSGTISSIPQSPQIPMTAGVTASPSSVTPAKLMISDTSTTYAANVSQLQLTAADVSSMMGEGKVGEGKEGDQPTTIPKESKGEEGDKKRKPNMLLPWIEKCYWPPQKNPDSNDYFSIVSLIEVENEQKGQKAARALVAKTPPSLMIERYFTSE